MDQDLIKNKTKILGNACIKLASVIPQKNFYTEHIRIELMRNASDLAIKSRGLFFGQTADVFANNLGKALDAATGCSHWLETILDAQFVDPNIVKPLLDECHTISLMFSKAFSTVKNSMD